MSNSVSVYLLPKGLCNYQLSLQLLLHFPQLKELVGGRRKIKIVGEDLIKVEESMAGGNGVRVGVSPLGMDARTPSTPSKIQWDMQLKNSTWSCKGIIRQSIIVSQLMWGGGDWSKLQAVWCCCLCQVAHPPCHPQISLPEKQNPWVRCCLVTHPLSCPHFGRRFSTPLSSEKIKNHQ